MADRPMETEYRACPNRTLRTLLTEHRCLQAVGAQSQFGGPGIYTALCDFDAFTRPRSLDIEIGKDWYEGVIILWQLARQTEPDG